MVHNCAYHFSIILVHFTLRREDNLSIKDTLQLLRGSTVAMFVCVVEHKPLRVWQARDLWHSGWRRWWSLRSWGHLENRSSVPSSQGLWEREGERREERERSLWKHRVMYISSSWEKKERDYWSTELASPQVLRERRKDREKGGLLNY